MSKNLYIKRVVWEKIPLKDDFDIEQFNGLVFENREAPDIAAQIVQGYVDAEVILDSVDMVKPIDGKPTAMIEEHCYFEEEWIVKTLWDNVK